ncbi:MAG TPA: hypothetical protein VNH65_04195 [Candidatus Acidoferrum sp.]|nr:hypothetical protein [Candidatus Acidoferrum sp.]
MTIGTGSLQAPTKHAIIRFFQLALMLLAVLPLVSLPGGAGNKPTSSIINVTTSVYDYDSGGVELLLRSDDYNATGQATYTSTSSGRSSLGSSILSNGEFQLTLFNQSLRTVWITPNDPVGSEPAGPPAGYYWDGTDVRSDCFDQNGNIVPLENVVTSSGNCKLGVNFNSGGISYKLLMSPFPFSGPGDGTPSCPSTGCPATGVATVTCNKVSNSQCVSWMIVPNVNAPNANVANLYWYSSSRGTATWVFIGQYHNTFRIGVANP